MDFRMQAVIQTEANDKTILGASVFLSWVL